MDVLQVRYRAVLPQHHCGRRKRVLSEPESAIAEGCCIIMFRLGASSVGGEVEDRTF
jgi:hypothetical protein